MTAIRQIPEDRLKSSLRAAAVLRIPFGEFAETSGISLETHEGNLGEQREALLEADDGSQYMLVEHCEGPVDDVELRLDERTPRPDLAVDRFLKTFELPPATVVWRVAETDWRTNRGSEKSARPHATHAPSLAGNAGRMYADAVTVVVRQTDDPSSDDVEELIARSIAPRDGYLDPDSISRAARSEAMRRGFARIALDERRSYVGIGASGVSVTFILELLGSGATAVAMQELLNFIKARISTADDDGVTLTFGDTPTAELLEQAVLDAERGLGLPRGDLEVEELERRDQEIQFRARSRYRDHRYEVVLNADGELRARRLTDVLRTRMAR